MYSFHQVLFCFGCLHCLWFCTEATPLMYLPNNKWGSLLHPRSDSIQHSFSAQLMWFKTRPWTEHTTSEFPRKTFPLKCISSFSTTGREKQITNLSKNLAYFWRCNKISISSQHVILHIISLLRDTKHTDIRSKMAYRHRKIAKWCNASADCWFINNSTSRRVLYLLCDSNLLTGAIYNQLKNETSYFLSKLVSVMTYIITAINSKRPHQLLRKSQKFPASQENCPENVTLSIRTFPDQHFKIDTNLQNFQSCCYRKFGPIRSTVVKRYI